MNVKSLKSQLFAAVVMMLVACVALGSSTYAWFAINNKVTATGMSVTAQTSKNLLICNKDTADTTGSPRDLTYGTTAVLSSTSVKLYPVSSIDGTDFFYTETSSVASTGAATQQYYALGAEDNTSTSSAFNDENGETATAFGYVDYTFSLEAIGRQANEGIVLETLTLTYGGNDDTGAKAFRVAMFQEELQKDSNMTSVKASDPDHNSGVVTDAPSGNLVTILKASDAMYFNEGAKAVDKAGPYNASDALADVTSLSTPAVVFTSDNAATDIEYFRVTLRIWLEGEDTKCNVQDFLSLTQAWALDAHFAMGQIGENNANGMVVPVKVLTVAKTETPIEIEIGATVSADAKIVDSKPYYKIGNTNYYKTESAAVTGSERIFTISDNDVTDVTNQITFTSNT